MDPSFDDKVKTFEARKQALEKAHPLRIIQNEPKIPQITPKTARFLKLKSLVYLLKEDHKKIFKRYIFKRPFFYGKNFLKSVIRPSSFTRDGDAFYYGLKNHDELLLKLKNQNALLVVGFSYCHKPLECPSGRFTSACKNDPSSQVCGQCLIHKYKQLAQDPKTLVFVIPTIHYIGEKILKIKKNYPNLDVYFVISACELTLSMFGDWGNMAAIHGVGIRLGGRICNTMSAFELSERGIKPGLTTLSKQADDVIVSCLGKWHTTQAAP